MIIGESAMDNLNRMATDGDDKEGRTQLIENCIAMYYRDPTKSYQELADFLYDCGIRSVCHEVTE